MCACSASHRPVRGLLGGGAEGAERIGRSGRAWAAVPDQQRDGLAERGAAVGPVGAACAPKRRSDSELWVKTGVSWHERRLRCSGPSQGSACAVDLAAVSLGPDWKAVAWPAAGLLWNQQVLAWHNLAPRRKGEFGVTDSDSLCVWQTASAASLSSQLGAYFSRQCE